MNATVQGAPLPKALVSVVTGELMVTTQLAPRHGFADLSIVQRAWDEAQHWLSAGMLQSASLEAHEEWDPCGFGALGEHELIFGHVRAAAQAMGFTGPRPVLHGLNERVAGRLRIEEMFADHVELAYGALGCDLAAALRDPRLAMTGQRPTSLLEARPVPRWILVLLNLLRTMREPLSDPPTVVDEPYGHISWRSWLLSTPDELEGMGVPLEDVVRLRKAHTGHEKNMRLPAARTIGDWGGIRTETEIARRTFQEIGRVRSYKKKNERRRGGKTVLKTYTGDGRFSQGELAWFVGEFHADSDPHEVCVDLGILRIEQKLYQRLWTQILLRSQTRDMRTREDRLAAACEIVPQSGLSIFLPREHWRLSADTVDVEDGDILAERERLMQRTKVSGGTDLHDAAAAVRSVVPVCELCRKRPGKHFGGYDQLTCQKCYAEWNIR